MKTLEQSIPVTKIATEVAKYISHSTHIAENSSAYKSNASFMASLQACKSITRWISSCQGSIPTKSFCRQILENQGHLYNILPNPSNKSFKNSMAAITGIINAAKTKIQTLN